MQVIGAIKRQRNVLTVRVYEDARHVELAGCTKPASVFDADRDDYH
jgi:uncharacterized protein YqiB (DUF1249 family)